MTSNELLKFKIFLSKWTWVWVSWLLLACIGLFFACLMSTVGPNDRIDGALFVAKIPYVIALACLPATLVFCNHLIVKSREKVGLTPEARAERMRRLQRERDEAEAKVRDRDRIIRELEEACEV
jgi:hypothetical protein